MIAAIINKMRQSLLSFKKSIGGIVDFRPVWIVIRNCYKGSYSPGKTYVHARAHLFWPFSVSAPLVHPHLLGESIQPHHGHVVVERPLGAHRPILQSM